MVYADCLINSKSSFSYKPALLNKGVKICSKNFWYSYPKSKDWILADNDGLLIIDNWVEALEYMKEQINKNNFDICLLDCGVYGSPLAAHIKCISKKAVHIGGSLQLLFGIKGKRWEDENFGEQTFHKKEIIFL